MELSEAAVCEILSDDAPRAAEGLADWARPMLDRQLAVLAELAEIGLAAARAIQAEISAPPGPPHPELVEGRGAPEPRDLPTLALALDRVSRAVRMSIALQSRLIEALDARMGEGARQVERDAADEEAARRDRVGRIVWRVAADSACEDTAGRDEESVQRMIDEAHERMEDEDLFGDVMSGPISDIVERICRDLGLSPDWPRLAEEAWAKAEMQSGQVGTPLAAFRPAVPPQSPTKSEPRPIKPPDRWPRPASPEGP